MIVRHRQCFWVLEIKSVPTKETILSNLELIKNKYFFITVRYWTKPGWKQNRKYTAISRLVRLQYKYF